jgi:5-oxoprolinase (ATP-hydrolysing)
MPPDGTCLGEEGVVIDTFALRRDGTEFLDSLREILTRGRYPSRDPETNLADIAAQRAAGVLGCNYLQQLVESMGMAMVNQCVEALFHHAEGLVTRWIESLPQAALSFRDSLDDGTVIAVTLKRDHDRLVIDFDGTAPVHPGCFNATPAIVTAATIYVLRCVIGGTLPMNQGILRPIDLVLPTGLLNPPKGNDSSSSPAVVAGNVETSMRIVDCLLGALGLAAASQGTMNNVLIGDSTFGYYETIGGGSGACADGPGASGVHSHMTNTRITDPEVYESRYPVRLWRFELRQGSGGKGQFRGGEGLVREIEFLKPLSLALITNRRGKHQPWGANGGEPGAAGENLLIKANGEAVSLPSATTLTVQVGDRLVMKTPGGGGWGKP